MKKNEYISILTNALVWVGIFLVIYFIDISIDNKYPLLNSVIGLFIIFELKLIANREFGKNLNVDMPKPYVFNFLLGIFLFPILFYLLDNITAMFLYIVFEVIKVSREHAYFSNYSGKDFA